MQVATRCATHQQHLVFPEARCTVRPRIRSATPLAVVPATYGMSVVQRSGGRALTSAGLPRSREASVSPDELASSAELGDSGNALLNSPHSDGELRRVLPFVLTAALAALLFGYHLGVVNAALAPLSAELGLASPAAQGAVVSLLLLGACVGSFAGGTLADALGRREALRLACLPLCLGALACFSASTPTLLFAGRLITGAGLGITSAVAPLYISEVSPPAHRGLLGCVNQISICTGILLSQLAGLALTWRPMFALGALPAALLCAWPGRRRAPPR
jgi:hypothetical protein